MVYYFIGTDKLDENFMNKALKLLTTERIKKAESFRKKEDKFLSVAAYILMLYGLKKEGISLHDFSLEYNNYGKPCFASNKQVHFNLSHSKTGIACAISDTSIGVDIQEFVPVNELMLKKVCSSEEIIKIKNSKNPSMTFTNFWTMKESYVKATGKGITESLAKINFIDAGEHHACIGNYFLTSNTYDDYVITVCNKKKAENNFNKVLLEDIGTFINCDYNFNH